MQCTQTLYSPSCLVADAAGAITNGFVKAMGYGAMDVFLRVICWQHVKRNHIRTVHYVEWVSKDWIKSRCSCVYWSKVYFCHHVVGLAIFKKKAAYLDIHMCIDIGQTKPRGQPKKIASALTKQNDVSVSTDSSAISAESEPSPLKTVKKVVKKVIQTQTKKQDQSLKTKNKFCCARDYI